MNLPKGSLVTLDSTQLSEHNRAVAQISYELIQIGDRTITGTMRRQALTNKRTLVLSWERLPALDTQTVDGKAGRNAIQALVDTATNLSTSSITVTYYEVNTSNVQTSTTIYMFVDSYGEELVKRFESQLWNVNLTLVEV